MGKSELKFRFVHKLTRLFICVAPLRTIFMVKTLNNSGIKVFSLAEGEINFISAHTFFPTLIQAGAAEYDNLLRADNTIRGMRQAQIK